MSRPDNVPVRDPHKECVSEVERLQHNVEVLTNALWKACGDDEQLVNDCIESQGTLL